MLREFKTTLGTVDVAKDVLATYIGLSATNCFGVVGMSSTPINDGFATLLGRDSISRAVEFVEIGDALLVNV